MSTLELEPERRSESRADPSQRTKDNLLDAAEALFAEEGIESASLRAITARAGVNLAAVNYHFQSKEGLVRAVFSRRIEPLNRERLALLDDLERAGTATVEGVLRAFIGPVIRRRGEGEGSEALATFRRLIGRMYSTTGEHHRLLLHEHFAEVAERFPRALARGLPGLQKAELLWRFHFLLGSMIQVTLNGELLVQHSGGACDLTDSEGLIDRLVAYSAAGFRAALPSLKSTESEQPPVSQRPDPPPDDWAVWET